MPFGLTNAPATFQELMNQVVARMKLKPTLQALLKKGAVIEVYIDDVVWGQMTLMTIYVWWRSFYALVKNAIPA